MSNVIKRRRTNDIRVRYRKGELKEKIMAFLIQNRERYSNAEIAKRIDASQGSVHQVLSANKSEFALNADRKWSLATTAQATQADVKKSTIEPGHIYQFAFDEWLWRQEILKLAPPPHPIEIIAYARHGVNCEIKEFGDLSKGLIPEAIREKTRGLVTLKSINSRVDFPNVESQITLKHEQNVFARIFYSYPERAVILQWGIIPQHGK